MRAFEATDTMTVRRVKAINRQTGREHGIALLGDFDGDIEAFEEIRRHYPKRLYKIVDRETGEEIELDS
jgi:hypothetical protein